MAAYNGHSEVVEKIINHLKKHDNLEYTDLILNKVNPYSNLSTLAYAILNCGDGGAKGNTKLFHINKKDTSKKNKKKKDEKIDPNEIKNLKFAEYFEIAKMLIENDAKSYYEDGDEQKDFSPIFMAV